MAGTSKNVDLSHSQSHENTKRGRKRGNKCAPERVDRKKPQCHRGGYKRCPPQSPYRALVAEVVHNDCAEPDSRHTQRNDNVDPTLHEEERKQSNQRNLNRKTCRGEKKKTRIDH